MKNIESFLLSLFITALALIFIQGCENKTDNTPPDEVTNLAAVVNDSTINITWKDPLQNDLSSIDITYRDTLIHVAKGVEKLTVNHLIDDQEYLFTVSVTDLNGNRSKGSAIKIIYENPRNRYIGNYNFLGYYLSTYQNVNITEDTITYKGSIEKASNNQLRVIFKSPNKEPVIGVEAFPMPIDGIVYITLGDSGKFMYPELVDHSNYYYFKGNFIGNDSIYFEYGMRSHAGYQYNVVRGIKSSH